MVSIVVVKALPVIVVNIALATPLIIGATLFVVTPVVVMGTVIVALVVAAGIVATAIIAAATIAAAIIVAAIIAASTLIATHLALPLVRSLAAIAAFGVCFATLLFMSGLKLRCLARIGILAEAAFKVGDHLLCVTSSVSWCSVANSS